MEQHNPLVPEMPGHDEADSGPDMADDRFGFTREDIQHPQGTLDESFPVDVFPLRIQEFIRESVDKLQFSKGKLGALILAAGGAAIGNSYHAQVRNLHSEPPIIWLVICDYPGSKKTPTTNHVLKPFRDHNENCYRNYERLQDEYEYELKRRKESQKEDQERPPKPVLKRSMVDDITYEALVQTHAENPRGLLLNADEITSWADNLNRYNRGSADTQWNKIWSGLPLDVQRKSGSYLVPRSCISIIGNIQPDSLRDLLTKQRMSNGFFERFDFLDQRDEPTPWSEDEFDPELYKSWNGIITRLLDLPFGNGPVLLKPEPDAKAELYGWQKQNAMRTAQAIDSLDRSQLAKGESKVVRYALILQVLADSCNHVESTAIKEPAVKGAIRILSFFQGQNEKIGLYRQELLHLVDRQDAWKLKLCQLLPKNFTTAQATELGDKVGKSVRSIKEALKDTKYFARESHGKYENKYGGDPEQ
jgi:hypothetical protein